MSRKVDNIDGKRAKAAITEAFSFVSDLFFRGGRLGWSKGDLLITASSSSEGSTKVVSGDTLAFVEDMANGRTRKGVEELEEAVVAYDSTLEKMAVVRVSGRRYITCGALDWKQDPKARARIVSLLRQSRNVVLDQPSEAERTALEAFLIREAIPIERVVTIPKPTHNDLRDYLAGSWWIHVSYQEIKNRALDKALRGALKLRSIRGTTLETVMRDVPREAFGKEDQTPTEKQISYARALAKKNNVTIPEEVLTSRQECSAFISRWKNHTSARAVSRDDFAHAHPSQNKSSDVSLIERTLRSVPGFKRELPPSWRAHPETIRSLAKILSDSHSSTESLRSKFEQLASAGSLSLTTETISSLYDYLSNTKGKTDA